MSSNTRVYCVQSADEFRLVEATSKQAALRHVAASKFSVNRVSEKTLIAAMRDGVQIELAGAEEPEAEAATAE